MKAAPWACLLLVGCSAGPAKTPAPHSSLLSSVALAPTYRTPATWRYHPSQQPTVRAERALPDGRILLAGKRGERWVLDPHAQSLAAGASLAPEDLIAVLDTDEGFRFVGKSGTSYDARDPLGKFLRSSAPLEPLVRVTAARHSILGIPANGTILRSADGAASFAKVGPANVQFADVELASDGTGLALAIPEALWLTRDEGATWAPLPGNTHGALALSRNQNGHIEVDTVFGPYHLLDQPARIEAGKEPDRASVLGANRPPRGPDAAALADGRALIQGARYLEVSAPPAHPSDYQLFQGPLDGKLESKPIPELKGCRSARLAGFANFLELACLAGNADSGSVPVSFFRSADGGEHFEAEPFGGYANVDAFRFALGEGGRMIASGLCGAPAPGCATNGVFLRREPPPDEAPPEPGKIAKKRPKFELFAAATPSLAETALGLTFSLDGRTAYAVARRTKTAALAVFVSTDRGKSYEVRDLDLVRADAEDEDNYWEQAQASVRVETFAPAEDGSLALVLAGHRGRSLVVLDEQGHLLSASKPPDDRAVVSAVGMRAFALAPSSRKTWESMDGGVTWQALGRFPIALCAGEGECYVKVRCAPLGCVIGSDVSRIGWAGQSDEDVDALPPPALEPSTLTERKLRTPLSCSLDDSKWQTLPGVRDFPSSHDAAMGKAAFVSVGADAARGAAWTIHGVGGAHPRLETVSLLAPLSERPAGYAIQVLDQVEGGAALRYRLPPDPVRDSHLRNVEVAWDNALTAQVAHARLPDGGPIAVGDVENGDPIAIAQPALLSIGEGGLYLRLHHNAGDVQETAYFDGRTITHIPAVKWPNSQRGARTEMARSDGAHLPLMLFEHGTVVARARLENGGFTFDAETIGLPEPAMFGQQLTERVSYLGSASGMHIQAQSLLGTRPQASFFPFRATGAVMGAPTAVPTQASLPDRPNRCGANDIASTPRIDANFLPGTRRAIVVSDASDAPRLFLSSGAVLYGTPENPCAAALDAEEIALDGIPPRHERVLVLLDDLEHTWLFRQTQDSAGTAQNVQFRTLKCHFEPDAEIPSEVYRAQGTLVSRGN